MIKHLNQMINKQITQQNLRELASIKTNGKIRILARLTFLNLMSANGVMAKTIIRNYKQKQERKSYDDLRQYKNNINEN
jgi:hypothetical protein